MRLKNEETLKSFFMDRYHRPKVFRSKKVCLRAKDADQQVKDFYEGEV